MYEEYFNGIPVVKHVEIPSFPQHVVFEGRRIKYHVATIPATSPNTVPPKQKPTILRVWEDSIHVSENITFRSISQTFRTICISNSNSYVCCKIPFDYQASY